MLRIISLLIACIVCIYAKKYTIPSDVILCKQDDPNMDECWNKSFMMMVKRIANGLPDMNLRKIDPVEIDEINMILDSPRSSVAFDAILKNVSLWGLSDTILDTNSIKFGDVVNYTFTATVPYVHLVADYTAKGRVLLFQLDAGGAFEGNYTDLKIQGFWQGERYMKKNAEYLKWNKNTVEMTIDPKNMHMHFGTLFRNNPEISDNINKVINENMDSLYEEVKPVVEQTVKTILESSINQVYDAFPLDVLYPK